MASVEHAPLTPPLPERVGTVRITGRIGHGAMGEVLQGFDEELGRPVAVKVLAHAPDDEARERFDREALALARLTHPNVVAVYTKGLLDGRPYFTMELVDGPTVEQILESQGPFTVDEAWEIIRQAATGLRSAAEHGVTHRDVKPGNLLVGKDGTVKVADFGVCKISGRTPAMTEDGTTLGTPFYMSPEQARGEAVDQRADQYSLGATFFHLVTGTPPYESTQTMAQLMAHQKEPIPDIRTRRPDVTPAVSVVLQRMMAKKPEDRFDSYDEMMDAMEDALSGRAPSRITLGRVAFWGSALALTGVIAVLPSLLEARIPVEEERPIVVRVPKRVVSPEPAPIVTQPPQRPAPEEIKSDLVESLLTQMREAPPQHRQKVMSSLARTQDTRAKKALQDILRDSKDPDAPLAAVLLGEIGDQTATDALIAALHSPRRATVLAAVDALVTLRDVRAVEPLKALAARHDDATVRTRAKRAGGLLFTVDGDN